MLIFRHVITGLILSGLLSVTLPATADENHVLASIDPAEATELWMIGQGGQLYDNWWKVLNAEPPEATHTAYPTAGPGFGAATWRCRDCHGWDYKGKDGVSGTGVSFTGIIGLADMAGKDPAAIAAVIFDDIHQYRSTMISPEAAQKLALFLSKGQIDMDRYIDRATGSSLGDRKNGAGYFQTICANCHGQDGRALNFGSPQSPLYVGTVARENPWEILHKIRFGQPGQAMVSMIALDAKIQADILAYIQTLPEK